MAKKTLYTGALQIIFTVTISLLCAEIVSLLVYVITQGKAFSYQAISRQQLPLLEIQKTTSSTELNSQPGIGKRGTRYAVHPYLGFVWQPDSTRQALLTSFGLYGEVEPLVAAKNSNLAIVGIAGGSVAEHLYENSRDLLRESLKDLAIFKGRQVVFIMLGMSTYEQPQQLLALTYYLALGGRLDLLINLDGKNEATNSFANHQEGIFPAYPYAWGAFFHAAQPEYSAVVGKITLTQAARTYLARLAHRFRNSVTISTLWTLADQSLQGFAKRNEESLRKAPSAQEEPYFIAGPSTMRQAADQQLYHFISELWLNASVQMSQLAKGGAFPYFHFLQPNQYVANTKPFTSQEKSLAIAHASNHEQTVQAIYPLLEKGIESLHERGIHAYSLTKVFGKVEETLYVDNCCHLNKKGNDLLAVEIAKQIEMDLAP